MYHLVLQGSFHSGGPLRDLRPPTPLALEEGGDMWGKLARVAYATVIPYRQLWGLPLTLLPTRGEGEGWHPAHSWTYVVYY